MTMRRIPRFLRSCAANSIPKYLILAGIGRIKPCKDHRLDLLITRKWRIRWSCGIRYGIADLGIPDLLNPCNDKSDLPGREFLDRLRLWGKHTQGQDLKDIPGRHKHDLPARHNLSINDADEQHNPLIIVVP